jgi:hypothetical protein
MSGYLSNSSEIRNTVLLGHGKIGKTEMLQPIFNIIKHNKGVKTPLIFFHHLIAHLVRII